MNLTVEEASEVVVICWKVRLNGNDDPFKLRLTRLDDEHFAAVVFGADQSPDAVAHSCSGCRGGEAIEVSILGLEDDFERMLLNEVLEREKEVAL